MNKKVNILIGNPLIGLILSCLLLYMGQEAYVITGEIYYMNKAILLSLAYPFFSIIWIFYKK